MKAKTVLQAVLVTALALWPFVTGAQSLDPWEINADVDNDGMVGPTDIQHVINGALGLTEQGVDAVDRPLRQYIVASPRASLAPLPGAANADDACSTIGAATNFARPNGRLLVRQNTAIAFRYDRNVEGVWHEGACGLLRSALTVEIRRVPSDASLAEILADETSVEWTALGRDGAVGTGCGPALGTANVGVRFLFEEPGDYVVRCTITTAAIPQREVVAENESTDFCGATRVTDRVFTRIRVVDRQATAEDLRWQRDNNSNAIGANYGRQLENEVDTDVALP